MDDDEFLLDLISCCNDSKDVLELVRVLKEEGNVLYKQRKFEDALEKYGYAELVLARYEFVEKSDMGACFELAICVMLNSAACFGKKNKFENVGRICSIILEFEPSNVKALFRRTLAALELGRSICAYWDLLLAVEVDPNNREVASKLEEVKSSLRKEESIKRSQSVVPLGLGSSLSLPRKNTKGSLEQEARIEHKDVQRKVSTSGATDKRNHDGLASIVDSGPKGCSNIKGEKTLNEIKKKVNGKNEVKKSNLMEPKYRFANRRRSGSLMSISKKEYKLLSTGKSIQCMKLGYLMTVRVMMGTKEGIKCKDVCQEEIMVASSDFGQPNRIGVI
ncbi:hypothetical protein BVRB_3g068680 [Beta vulgaris subsp. vulgaris]|nr:hypothetical protein BVRB_3g068680 [Beta vulgaris subsp. vulgaris]